MSAAGHGEKGPAEAGGLLIAGFEGTAPSPLVVELIEERRLGGVILYGKNCVDARQVLELTNALQERARAAGHSRPLLVALDQEQGAVARIRDGVTLFPSMGALGRLDDPALVAEVAAAVSRELLAVGVNWNLAPVADVLSNPACPLGDRSFGGETGRVAALVAAWVRGAGSEGMISCLKHFPGHGCTGEDSHHATPVTDRGAGQIRAADLPAFAAGIEAGAPTVMTTHITFTALDPRRPATFSPAVIQGLLREEAGFGGVIVTDDLEMAGAARLAGIGEGAVEALGAGADLLLVSGMLLPERDLFGLLDGVARAVGEGLLPAGRLEESLGRVRALKDRYLDGKWRRSSREAAAVLRSPTHLALLEEVGRRCERTAGRAG